MLRNYLTTTFRILVRQKGYSIINLFGLTLGVTCSLLILLYVSDEVSYDRFHADADRIYRVNFMGKVQDREFSAADTGIPMAAALQEEVPAVESTIRLMKWNTQPVRVEEKAFTENHFLVADSNFFRFFHFDLIQGNPAEVLSGPNKLVITERAAQKYFGYKGAGDTSPIGKIVTLGSTNSMTAAISGIAANPPANSHLQFDMILSLTTWDGLQQNIWLNSSVKTYYKLKPGASVDDVNKHYTSFIEKYCAPELEKYLNLSLKQLKEQGGRVAFSSIALTDIHLRSTFDGELEPSGNYQYVYLFSAIAALIILLACINFMNLSTARSANRAKEVGIRKTVGAARGWLIRQFMMESFVYTILSIALAFILIQLAMGPFNLLTGKSLQTNTLLQPTYLLALLLFTVVVGLMAGSYPAFYLTSFHPTEVLKGKVRAGLKSAGIRNSLVVFQFFISITLIIATLIVYRQLQYVQRQNLGFEKENIINLLHTMRLDKRGEAFKQELLMHPEIVSASYSNRVPPNVDWNSTFRDPVAQTAHLLSIYMMDADHLKTMGFEVLKGRFFHPNAKADSSTFLLNETAARELGFLEDFEDKKLISLFNTATGDTIRCIGIVKDFNFASLHSKIGPLIIVPGKQPNWEMAIRLTAGDEAAKIKVVEEIWKKFAADAPFEYSFLDQNYDAKFRAEQTMGEVFLVFTSLAIVIACLGLLGLATFTAEQRAKEISIRKVLGADVPGLVGLLSRDFFVLILIALVIAVPVTWYGMSRWLEQYAYRVQYTFDVVVLGGGLALLIAFLTISYQALRAAVANPVRALKAE